MKRKSKYDGLARKKAIAGYLFILPFIVGFLLFMVKPLFQSLYMSFCDIEISTSGFTYNFTKLNNYVRAFTIDSEFNRFLVEEIQKMFFNSLAVMVFSFFVALILNQKFKGRALVRAVFFLPVIVASGVLLNIESSNTLISGIQNSIDESMGNTSITAFLETLLTTAGIGTRAFKKVFELVDAIYDVAIASGIQIIIFLSGLQTIPTNMYEAAHIEGCTAWESLWKITFPMTSSLMLVNWIYTIVDFCMRTDSDVMDKIHNTMMVQLNYGFSSAMAWIYFIIVIAIIGVSSLIISKAVYYYE